MSELQEHNSDVYISMRRQREEFQPELPSDATLAERIMWEANQDDAEWRHDIIAHVPDFLAIYFATKYARIFKKSGRRRANEFLLKTAKNVLPRFELVMKQYEFKHRASGTVPFPFIEQLERIAQLDRSAIKSLATGITNFMSETYQSVTHDFADNPPVEECEARKRLERVYTLLAKLTLQSGTQPPYWQQFIKGRIEPNDDQLCAALLRMMDAQWWYRRLKRLCDIKLEHLAIAIGQVQKSASPYVSRTTLHRWLEQKRSNWQFLKEFDLEDEDGNRTELSKMVLASVSNPAIKRCELMVRMRGFEDLAKEMGCVGEFYTITAPSRFHSAYQAGGFVKNWQGNDPRETQKYLCKVWAKIRAAYSRAGIRVFGFRVTEPHHDGTPHWHMLLFVRPEQVEALRDIFCYYARLEDSEELQTQKALKARFHVEPIDEEKGSATGYIAKYISKNIDGYAMDDEVDGETGQKCKDMARAVSAWASHWKIRQFQQIGGAPVSVWRELRRMGDDTTSSDGLDIDFAEVHKAADRGYWGEYTKAQGGAFVRRADLVARLWYEREEKTNAYGEPVDCIKGVFCTLVGEDTPIITRVKNWQIVPKLKADNDPANGRFLPLSGGAAAPWSSVNNCTEARRTINDNKKLVEKIIDYADSIGMDFSRFMARSLIMSGKISINEQPFKLWTNGSFIPVETERQKQVRREALRQRINNLGEMRKL
ncbi:replication endonuclease [Xenorhabdus sp. SF857]|uniref:replication endonuclease n=1 Tax=Xenorhabdus bakwenae TaxID=3026967 RepID=UPI002557E590|nr:replication endonuclease [Xenorhabdus sp. SF857]WFQ80908.1 replication endonuclease [Xenorhabdus sp. SF857]